MARTALCALALICLAASVNGCAFPKQACMPAVCSSHSLSAFNALLDKNSFWANSSGTQVDFSKVPSTLGYYYGRYNTRYNGGKYDGTKTALRDGAPSLNYFELRNTMGAIQKTGIAMSRCCSLCSKGTGCSLWLFNPYIKTVRNADGTRTKQFDITGDCYFLLQSDKGDLWTYDKVNALCSSDTASFVDSTVKPYFYGGKCNSEVSDDPHFVGAKGTRFDFNGELDKSFCLLTDEKLQLNALLRGYAAPGEGETGLRSWMKEIGIVWVSETGHKHTVRLVARSGPEQDRGNGYLVAAELDGYALEIPTQPGTSVGKGEFSLTYEGVGKAGKFDVDNYQIKIGDLLDLHAALRPAHPKLQTPEDAEVHFNLVFDGLKVTEKVHGVLGQTYRQTESQEMKAVKYSALTKILGAPVHADGKTGAGFLDGEPHDYLTSDVIGADCKFSAMSV